MGGGDGNDTITGGDYVNAILGDGYTFALGNPLAQLDQLKNKKLVTAIGLIPTGSGEDKIIGGDGIDFIIGGNEKDLIAAGDGFNIVFGDEVTLGGGETTDLTQVFTDPSNATQPIEGGLTGTGDDVILGGSFVDVFVGGNGNDDLRSYGGIDLLFGNDGNDILCGGPSHDILLAGNGDDWLDGGPNTDVHQGDAGSDRFVFDNPDDERDSFWNFGNWISDYGQDPGDVDVSGTLNNSCFVAHSASEFSNLFPTGSSVVTTAMRSAILAEIQGAIASAESALAGQAQYVTYTVDSWISTIGGVHQDTDANGGSLRVNRMQNTLALAPWLSDQVNLPVELKQGSMLVGGNTTADQRSVLRDGMVFIASESAPDPLPPQLGFLTLQIETTTPAVHEMAPAANEPVAPTATPSTTNPVVAEADSNPSWLAPLVSAAQQRWLDAVPGASDTLLDEVEFRVLDLPGTVLGQFTRLDDSYQILIDVDAAGIGWFVDPTPLTDEEFLFDSGAQSLARGDSAAHGRVDALTVIQHEMGHLFGLPDLGSVFHPDSLMTGTMSPGIRRVPTSDDSVWNVVGTFPDSLQVGESHLMHLVVPRDVVNGLFEVSDPAETGFGWSQLGAAFVRDGAGVLEEGNSFNSRLSQSLEIPAAATALRFSVAADFGNDPTSIGDAFEFALLDAHTGLPLQGAVSGLANTDATINIQRDGTTYLAPTASSTALPASGSQLDLSETHVFRIDLSGLTDDTVATLYFDLLGFGEFDSSIQIDEVVLEGIAPPALAVDLDPAFDSGASATDHVTNLVAVDLIGSTEPFVEVSLDVDGDGNPDTQTTADSGGNYRFSAVPLGEGTNDFRVQAGNSQGVTTESVSVELDTAPPEAVLNAPLPGQLTNVESGLRRGDLERRQLRNRHFDPRPAGCHNLRRQRRSNRSRRGPDPLLVQRRRRQPARRSGRCHLRR